MSTSESQKSQMGNCPACRAENVPLNEVNGLFICEKCSSKRFSNKVRKSIQEAFERQEDQKKRELWVKRMEIAKRGVKAYDDGRMAEALKLFKEYISILEARYKVPPGYLQVSLFNKKEDVGEILLLAGIYWDMAKIYDHIKGQSAEVRRSLNKYVEFSIDKPHLIMASEAVRRYIASGSAANVQEFKNAHVYLQNNMTKCFIASAVFGFDSEEVAFLRNFRDHVLAKSVLGKCFIKSYYFIGPALAKPVRSNAVLKKLSQTVLRKVIQKIEKKT